MGWATYHNSQRWLTLLRRMGVVVGGASGCCHSGGLMCLVRVEANASATAHRAHGAACFSFFLLFRVGLWPRTWSLFLQVPRACAPFFWLFRVGCLGQLSVSGGWDLLMDGAPGCGWDLTGVARVGAKCPCLSFCSSGCACFAFPLGFCFSLHAGATAPATIVGRLVFGFFFFLSVSLFFACLGWRVAVFWEQRGPPPLPPLVLPFDMGGTCCPC